MPLDYIILMVIGVTGSIAGLLLVREAKKYRSRQDQATRPLRRKLMRVR